MQELQDLLGGHRHAGGSTSALLAWSSKERLCGAALSAHLLLSKRAVNPWANFNLMWKKGKVSKMANLLQLLQSREGCGRQLLHVCSEAVVAASWHGKAQLCPRCRMCCCLLAVLLSNGACRHDRLAGQCSSAGNTSVLCPVQSWSWCRAAQGGVHCFENTVGSHSAAKPI